MRNSGSTDFKSTEEEKDLRVTFDPSLTFSRHCEIAANKANRMFGLIMSQAYHSSWKGWLVLWAYGSGQKTQHCQLYYTVVIKFILDPNNVKY